MGDLRRLKTYWQDQAPVRGHAVGNAADRTPESVSMILRNTRILEGYSLSDVAYSINVREVMLEAIEDGRFSELPPIVYAKGFVAAYARFLHLDVKTMVARFCREVETIQAMPTHAPLLNLAPVVPDKHESRIPSPQLLLGALALLIVFYGGWQMIETPSHRAAALAVPPLPARFQTMEQPKPVLAETLTPAPIPTESVITLHAVAATWVEIRDETKGQVLRRFDLNAGDIYTLPRNSLGHVLTMGNLAAIGLMVDDQPVRVTAAAGKHDYSLTLDPTRLHNGTAILD